MIRENESTDENHTFILIQYCKTLTPFLSNGDLYARKRFNNYFKNVVQIEHSFCIITTLHNITCY